jgi:hypothetical protein
MNVARIDPVTHVVINIETCSEEWLAWANDQHDTDPAKPYFVECNTGVEGKVTEPGRTYDPATGEFEKYVLDPSIPLPEPHHVHPEYTPDGYDAALAAYLAERGLG